jgi:uncharacterized protein YjiS (DUF1127 family)
MTYSLLFGERPSAAASSVETIHPIRAFMAWIKEARARHAQRVALSSLLDFDQSLLNDLGISRADVVAALQNPSRRPGQRLSARRAQAASDWLSHP